MKIKIITAIILVVLMSGSCNQGTPENQSPQVTAQQPVDFEGLKIKGTDITTQSFFALSGKLKAALEQGGVPNALEYCKISAYPLIDSLSELNHATIRRTSLKLRNSDNAPSPRESAVLKQFESSFGLSLDVEPFVEDLGEAGVNYYGPIWVQKNCLQCHGVVGETLTTANNDLVRTLYPNDTATGYSEGDFRGMWVVNFKKGNNPDTIKE